MRLVKGERVINLENENMIEAFKQNGFEESEEKPKTEAPKKVTKATK